MDRYGDRTFEFVTAHRLPSDYVGRRQDPLVAQIDFSLAAMMCHMNVHGEQDFLSGQPPIGVLCGLLICSSAEKRVGYFRFFTVESCVSAIFFSIFDTASMSFDWRSIAICRRRDSSSLISLRLSFWF